MCVWTPRLPGSPYIQPCKMYVRSFIGRFTFQSLFLLQQQRLPSVKGAYSYNDWNRFVFISTRRIKASLATMNNDNSIHRTYRTCMWYFRTSKYSEARVFHASQNRYYHGSLTRTFSATINCLSR